jgi:hypothetical protein
VGVFNYKDIYCEMKDLIRNILREHTREIGESKKITTSEFIERAKAVHGDKYDYSKVDYKGATHKVEIICPKHGEFLQGPYNHLNGSQCPKCAGREVTNTQEFINKAKEVHGDKYDYSKVDYKGATTPVNIICPIHGETKQRPVDHIRSVGCVKCGNELKKYIRLKPVEEFLKQAKEVHGDKYDYSKVDYKNTETKIKIICPIHGEFLQSPHSHLGGKGCPKCAGKNQTEDDFIRKAQEVHGNKYDYSQLNFKNMSSPVTIICPIHGKFTQNVGHHLNGHGCFECGSEKKIENRRMSIDDFVKQSQEIHGDKYDYSKTENVKSNKDLTTIICPVHGEFLQSRNSHLRGRGCPLCRESKGEKLINNLLKQNGINFERQYRFDDCTNKFEKFCVKLPFDFYLPDLNVAIEYDGVQHFVPSFGPRSFEITQRNDKFKNNYCRRKNIKLIRIPYTWDTEKVKTQLIRKLRIK